MFLLGSKYSCCFFLFCLLFELCLQTLLCLIQNRTHLFESSTVRSLQIRYKLLKHHALTGERGKSFLQDSKIQITQIKFIDKLLIFRNSFLFFITFFQIVSHTYKLKVISLNLKVMSLKLILTN